MPNVKTRTFRKTSKSGEVMEFRAAITIDKDGVFTVNIPEQLAPTALKVLDQPIWKSAGVSVSKAREHWRVQGRMLGSVESFVEAAMDDHLSVEVKHELVIRYRYQNHTTFARAADGSMHPNGHFAEQDGERDGQRSWAWAGNEDLSASNRPLLFRVGVVARVYLKTTYTRPSGSRVVHSNDLPGSHWDRNPMRRLNGFCVHEPDTHSQGFHDPTCDSEVREIPYSDAAALFFADMMLAMARLGEQLDAFVGNQDALKLAIDRGYSLLPGPKGG
jgi:hypothetical protein